MNFNRKKQGGNFDNQDYSFGQNQGMFNPNVQAKNTLLSEPKSTQGSFVPNPPPEFYNESLFAKQSELKDLQDSNNNLRSKLATLANDKDDLENEIQRLKRKLENLEAEAEDRNKWRRRALDAEGQLTDVQGDLDSQKKKRQKEGAARREEIEKLEDEVKRLESVVKEKEKEVRELSSKVSDSKHNLEDLLKNLGDNSGDANLNKELLQEIIKKVDELNIRSKAER